MWTAGTTLWDFRTSCGVFRLASNVRQWKMMRVNRLAFVLFSLAILFSMVREWGEPIACARTIAIQSAPAETEKVTGSSCRR